MQPEGERTSRWEEWPNGRDATTWHAGRLVELPLVDWGATVARFMGCGFRVRVPGVGDDAAALNFARGTATRVGDLFGQPLDAVAWRAIASLSGSLVIEGGWEYRPGESFGAPWTRVAQGGRTHADARIVRAVRLPWAWSSDTPTAGLPMISSIEAIQAERHLDDVNAGLGLWFNHRDELCMSTAGPVLVQSAKRSWIFPERAAGLVSNWAFFGIANRLGALPATVTQQELDMSLAVCAVSELANISLIEAVDGRDSKLDLDQVASLMRVRRELF